MLTYEQSGPVIPLTPYGLQKMWPSSNHIKKYGAQNKALAVHLNDNNQIFEVVLFLSFNRKEITCLCLLDLELLPLFQFLILVSVLQGLRVKSWFLCFTVVALEPLHKDIL